MRDLSIPALHLIRTITLFISILLGLNVMVADTANTTACVPGVKLGAAIFNSPNVSSVLVVGASYNISWRYGALATKPPSAVDVLIQPYSNGAIEKWDQLVIDGYNGTDGRPPTSYSMFI
ncbi:hypothetical protein BJ742DRAFT_155856 [Cladochytrium replicatum]|nr:hypothetical protein BJ742DRAFT_155856 [Cladochytrium replicatum]